MTEIDTFSPEEWQTLQFATLWTFSAVAGADRVIDKKEMRAFTGQLGDSSLLEGTLAHDLFASVMFEWDELFNRFATDPRSAENGLGEAAAILKTRGTQEEFEEFAGALLTLGRRVAEASGGWWFGLGRKVSKEEEAALEQIARTLGVEQSNSAT